MSDIKLVLNSYGQDMDQDDDDYSKCYETGMLVQANPDDLLSPLEKLCKYCTSENIFTRQMVARSIIETVQSIQTRQDCLSLLEIITQLSDDVEASVRSELMEQLPPCSLMIMDMRLVPNAISDYILPIMVKYLTGSNNQVRKLTQNALLQLIDQEIITRTEVERQICPVLMTLTEPDSGDDFRTEAVAMMTKIAPLIGSDAAERSFLERFGDLCADPLFHVRKVCASNFGDMCSVLPQDTTEQQLLPLFARLCEDGVWGVRKACAETFIAVSSSCSRQVRYDRLSPLFVGLLCDKSRWVQMASYQSLGQFISTFAEPEKSGFDVDEDGMLVRCPKLDTTTSSAGHDSPIPPALEDPSLESDRQTEDSRENKTKNDATTATTTQENLTTSPESTSEDQSFNNFEYWRTPIASLDNLDDIPNEGETTNRDATTTTPTTEYDTSAEENDDQRNGAVSPRPSVGHDDFLHLDPRGEGLHSDSDDDESNWSIQQDNSNYANSSMVDDVMLNSQTIVPPALLEHFISMTEASKIQTIDGDLARYCAYTLPGVVLALGPENWYLLKDTYELLSTDMQWKVRRTLAFSIHDLAIILGQEICVNDLLSIFNSFLKDLDEVREGVLRHLYDFINFLPCELQKEYLQLFNEFRTTDNMRKWRFRQDLALQLMNLSTLYTEEELAEYICPVAMELACDNVSEVRQHAFKLLCILIRRVNACRDRTLLQKFIASIMGLGAQHQHWVKRKSCAQIYLHFIEGPWLDVSNFANIILPSLITLCGDCVPNVRLIAAKTLMIFMKTEFFQSLPEDDEIRKSVDHSLESLQQDDDRDVRFFSGGKPKERTYSDTAEVDFDQHLMQSGVRMIRRGIHEYTIGNDDEDDDDDTELVEEVYIEDPGMLGDSNSDEEYYIEHDADNMLPGTTTQYLVEEVVEEVIETIKPSAPVASREEFAVRQKGHESPTSSSLNFDADDDK